MGVRFFSRFILAVMVSIVLTGGAGLQAAKQHSGRQGETLIPEKLRLENQLGGLMHHWQERFGTYPVLPFPSERFYPGDPVSAAWQFLQEHSYLLGTSEDLEQVLSLVTVRHSAGAEHVWFQQRYREVPVFSGEVRVHLQKGSGRVLMLSNRFYPDVQLPSTQPAISAPQALSILKREIGFSGEPFDETEHELVILPLEDRYALAWRVELPASKPFGVWEGFVDARSGRMLAIRNKVWESASKIGGNRVQRVDGTGKIFNPNPVVTLQDVTLRDMNDSDLAVPDSAYWLVPLQDITFDPADSLFHLSGPRVNIVDREAPANVPATSPNGEFLFTRHPDEFEDVMCYFHIDSAYSYIQNTLGHTLTGTILDALDVDSNGFNGDDNSHFVGSANPYIAFGHGGVDDAEDAEIILHEYGHAVHFAIVGGIGNTIENGSFSEGFGDMLGYAVFMANGASGGFNDRFVGDWDATSYNPGPPPFLRRVDGQGFPQGQPFTPSRCNEVHDCGEFFSAATWEMTQRFGAQTMLQVVIGSLYFQTPSDNYSDISVAIVMADLSLNGGTHVNDIIQSLDQWGLLDPNSLLPSMMHQPLHDTEDPTGPYPVTVEIVPNFAPLIADSILLHYSTDTTFSTVVPMLPTGQPNQYQADIPSQGGNVHIQYYISVQDSSGLRATLPAGAPQNFFDFFVGPDTIAPVITHSPPPFGDVQALPLSISATITDNLGVDSVWVSYHVNGLPDSSFALQLDSASVYSGNFPLDSGQVQVGDSLIYTIFAQDGAQAHNLASLGPVGLAFTTSLQQFRQVNIFIPDNNATGIRDTLEVINETPLAIADMDFRFKATHTWFGDLVVRLTGPNGQQVTLIDRPGVPATTFGNPGNNPDLILDDEAEQSIETVTAGTSDNIVGTFKPFPDSLSRFDLLNPAGQWIIHVSDLGSGDLGRLREWGVIFHLTDVPTSVNSGKTPAQLPERFALHPNFPNPFNPTTTIVYDLPRTSQVRLTIYNVLGQKVAQLVSGKLAAGRYRTVWDGRNQAGLPVSSGIYIMRLEATPVSGGRPFVQDRKIVLIK